jgi:tripartite-type tricarboxylate transporter receptor subunit TctC
MIHCKGNKMIIFRNFNVYKLLIASILFVVVSTTQSAVPYPTRPVTIVNQFAPGSISDATARLIAKSLQEQLGQPFIVENKVGAGGLIAATYVANAPPDGYTLLATSSSLHSGASLYKDLKIDPIKDFTHIARVGSFPSFIVIRSDLPVNTIEELILYAKKNPKKLSYGHGNNVGQMVGETLQKRNGIELIRVPYKSNPAAMMDLVAGHIDMMVPELNTGLPHIQSGKVKALALLTKTHNSRLPGVPTLNETVLPGFDVLPWGGISGPAGMQPETVAKLELAVQKALKDPDIIRSLTTSGIEPFWGGQKEFEQYVKTQLENWTVIIKNAGIQSGD